VCAWVAVADCFCDPERGLSLWSAFASAAGGGGNRRAGDDFTACAPGGFAPPRMRLRLAGIPGLPSKRFRAGV
jgi:hypothetical protein